MKPKISLILPTYNEKENIIPLLKRLRQILAGLAYEILVVDDNSPDKTAETVHKEFKKNSRIKVYIRRKNKSLAASIRFGLDKAKGNLLLVMDTDFNHDPEDIPKMIMKIRDFELVIGSRYIKGGGMEDSLRYFFSFVYNRLVQIFLGLKTSDNLSGFFLMKKESFQKINRMSIFKGYGDYFLRFLSACQRKQMKIAEIPVFYKNRPAGVSKSKFFKMLYDYSKTVIDLKYSHIR